MKQDGIKFEIVGLQDVLKALETLPEDLSDKALLEINKKVALIAKQEVEASVPSGDNDKKAESKIENNVIVTRGNKSDKTSVYVAIRNKAFHARFYEKGTASRSTKGKGKYRKGANRGVMPKKPFMEPAYQRAFPKMTEYFANNVRTLLTRSVTRMQKRLAKKLGQ